MEAYTYNEIVCNFRKGKKVTGCKTNIPRGHNHTQCNESQGEK